jgi:signal transduction histidine kinase
VKDWRHNINWVLAIVALLMLIGLAVVLMMVVRSYENEIDDVTQAATDAFIRSGVLKTPKDINVSIRDVSEMVATWEASTRIKRIFVSKTIRIDPINKTILLHPFYYASVHPNWRVELDSLRKKMVYLSGDKTEVAGRLYFDIDTGPLEAVRISIFVAMLSIFLLLVILVFRIFRQQQVLDVTTEVLEMNRLELIRMERLSLAGLLTANIFHDIRKPVTNIKHELGDLSEALGGFAGASRALRNMRDQVSLFFDILRDINLERFIRADEGEEEYVDVNRVVEQSLRLVQYERGATQLNLKMGSNLPLLLLPPYRLVQVLSNLLLNAYQALEGQGELCIVTFGADDSGEKVDDDAVATQVVIEISDNGPGIEPDALESIFTPFFSTKEADKGTGLGLYICKQIIEEYEGTVEVESTLGEGTLFRVTLPASE